MIDRKQIESILKINGVKPTSPDERIRSVLLSARYDSDEVDTAIMVLRENTKTNKTHVDGLHKVFRTNEALGPDEISQLLGIEVNVSTRVTTDEVHSTKSIFGFQNIVIGVLSFVVAILALVFFMYIYKIGIFYPSPGTY
jgi:GTP cyclohydrolase III